MIVGGDLTMSLAKLISEFLLATLFVCEIEGNPYKRNNEPETTKNFEAPSAVKIENLTAYLAEYNTKASVLCTKASNASWEYNVDLGNADKKEASNKAALEYAKYRFDEWNANIKDHVVSDTESDINKRQIIILKKIGTAALPQEDLEKYNEILNDMTNIFGTAKVCPYKKQNCDLKSEGLNLDPDLEDILRNSTDYDELTYVWRAWREATGKKSDMKNLYQNYVDYSNKAAKLNDEKDMGDFWILRYESDNFRQEMKAVWDGVKELYEKLFAYVRFRLSNVYEKQIPKDSKEPLPANILGDMWAQSWDNIYSHVAPYPNAAEFDITPKLQQQFGDNVAGMFEMANTFFGSLGLSDMSMAYGPKAMIVRPSDKEVICHASAWDFCDGEDFRIQMCTIIDQQDFVTIHHELGHIQYDLNYKDLPIPFREGANPGFHEAIGDVIALSVETQKHMHKIGFWDSEEMDPETTINYLMKMALQKIAFLPFGYMMDVYRWEIFNGNIKPEKYEYHWLKLRNELQGVIPPVIRSEADFDAGAKYHVPGDYPYIRYFVSYILQFQIHEALCREAGHPIDTEGLHTCDIYENKAAGTKLKEILEAGYSRNWKELLQLVINKDNLDATPIKIYFKKLTDYFDEEQAKHNYSTVWRQNAFEDMYEDKDDNDTDLAAIIVGAVLGVAVLVLVLGYFLKKKIFKSS